MAAEKDANPPFDADTPLSALFHESRHEELSQIIDSWRPYLKDNETDTDALAMSHFEFDFDKVIATHIYIDLGRLLYAHALKDDNMHGIKAVAPINAQTSMDPKEMREWIPNIKYGAHAFGYANFDDWLAHRSNCLADIERISPVALLRKVSPQHSPRFRFQYNAPLKPGELAKDPTHSPVFGKRFGEIAVAEEKGVLLVLGSVDALEHVLAFGDLEAQPSVAEENLVASYHDPNASFHARAQQVSLLLLRKTGASEKCFPIKSTILFTPGPSPPAKSAHT